VNSLLEPSPILGDGGHLIGRDPRKIGADEFDHAGIASMPILSVIRAKCLECCVQQADEVRKCVSTKCPNWPYRMGVNPFRVVNISDEERARRSAQGKAISKSRLKTPEGVP
jgi:hypothetical protein